MNALTRWEQYNPVSFGLEDMFRRLDVLQDSTATNYPPYNIVRLHFSCAITIALK